MVMPDEEEADSVRPSSSCRTRLSTRDWHLAGVSSDFNPCTVRLPQDVYWTTYTLQLAA